MKICDLYFGELLLFCVVFPLYGVFSPVFFVTILADDFVLLNKHYYYKMTNSIDPCTVNHFLSFIEISERNGSLCGSHSGSL